MGTPMRLSHCVTIARVGRLSLLPFAPPGLPQVLGLPIGSRLAKAQLFSHSPADIRPSLPQSIFFLR